MQSLQKPVPVELSSENYFIVSDLLHYFLRVLFYCLVVDRVCMESTACQTCVKRSPSPWSAMWSVPINHSFPRHSAYVCNLVCFVRSFVSISFYLLNHHRSYSCAFNLRIWDEIVIRQILNQNANFSLPPLLNLKLFPTTLLNAFTLLGQAMVSYRTQLPLPFSL